MPLKKPIAALLGLNAKRSEAGQRWIELQLHVGQPKPPMRAKRRAPAQERRRVRRAH